MSQLAQFALFCGNVYGMTCSYVMEVL